MYESDQGIQFQGGQTKAYGLKVNGPIRYEPHPFVDDFRFVAAHAGVRFRVAGKRVVITGVASSTAAVATVEETLASTAATTDWDEAAFSAAHGWPVCLCFHQDRLVLGGSRDLPNRLVDGASY